MPKNLLDYTDEDLRMMSDQDLQALKERLERGPKLDILKTGGTSPLDDFLDLSFDEEAPAQYEPGGGLMANLGKAASNVPWDIANQYRHLETAARNPLQTAKGAFMAVKGFGDVSGGQMGTPSAGVARQMTGQAIQSVSDPEQLVEHPVEAVANIAAIAAPALRGTRIPGLARVARGAELASDPLQTAVKGGAKVLGAGVKRGMDFGKWTGRMGAEVLGVMTGMQAGPVRESFLAGFEGNIRPFMEAINDQVNKRQIVDDTLAKLKQLKKEAGGGTGDFTKGMRQQHLTVEVGELKQAVVDDLAENFNVTRGVDAKGQPALDFSRSTITGKGRKQTANALQELLDKPDQIFAHDLHTIKLSMDDFFNKASGQANAAVGSAARKIRQVLYDQVDGYQVAMKPYHDTMGFLGELRDELGVNLAKPKKISTGRRLERALGEGREGELALIEEVSGRTDQPLRAQLAGQKMSQTVPTGLIGRAAIAGIATGAAAAGAILTPEFLYALAALPAFSPRFIGKQMARLGLAAGQAKRAEQYVSGLLGQAKSVGIPISRTITVAQLQQRLSGDTEQGEESQPPSLLRTLGQMQRGAP